MEQILYQQPREKLRNRGVRALTDAELLQVILGSGNKGTSVARIAKNVARLLEQAKAPSYQDLLSVKGLGHAKVSQVIAAVELGSRVHYQTYKLQSKPPGFSKIKASSKRIIEYITINGAGEHILERSEIIDTIPKATIVIRKIFADALHDSADSLLVGIGSRNYPLDMLDDGILEILKMIFDTASLLEIKINDVWLVNRTVQQPFRRKALK